MRRGVAVFILAGILAACATYQSNIGPYRSAIGPYRPVFSSADINEAYQVVVGLGYQDCMDALDKAYGPETLYRDDRGQLFTDKDICED